MCRFAGCALYPVSSTKLSFAACAPALALLPPDRSRHPSHLLCVSAAAGSFAAPEFAAAVAAAAAAAAANLDFFFAGGAAAAPGGGAEEDPGV